MRDTRRAKEENKNLKEELNKQLIENYIISNKEILNRNIFFGNRFGKVRFKVNSCKGCGF